MESLLWLGSFSAIAAAVLTTLAAAPVIDCQPKDQTVVLYQPTAFGVFASGSAPLSYQWRKDGVDIVGATNSQIVLSNVEFRDAGRYSVSMSDGENNVTSADATLTVNPPKGGDIDFSFAVGSSIDGVVFSLALQPDGKVIIGGGFNTVNGAIRHGTARLNADGTTDYTFLNCQIGPDNSVNSVAVQRDLKVLIAGDFTTVNGVARNGIARLNPDGSLDTGFQNGLSGADSYVYSLALQSDGEVLIGGDFSDVNGVSRRAIARLNANGTLDTGFQSSVTYLSPPKIYAIGVQGDGRILIGGSFRTRDGAGHTNMNVVRLNANGNLDSNFRDGTNSLSGADNVVRVVTVQSDGKALIGGDFSSVNGLYYPSPIARLNADGTVDNSFRNNLTTSVGSVRSIAIQSDDKLLVGGNRIVRLNGNGTPDSNFRVELTRASSDVSGPFAFSIGVQSDGKVLFGGAFARVNGIGYNQVARLNADGTSDTEFRNGVLEADNVILSTTVQSDGKVLIGGIFTIVSGVSRPGIARLNTDGSLDTSFLDGMAGVGGVGSAVASIAVQKDSKVLIGGSFTKVNGTDRNRIARLNGDGSVDSSFLNGLAGVGFDMVFSIALQSDGKVIIGGNFQTVNGVSRSRIARLNVDGSLDSFQSAIAGPDSQLYSVAVETDGRVLVGGYFTSVNGESRSSIARLNADGTLDTGFQNGLSGANGRVYSVAVQADGKVLIAGLFTEVNGVSRLGIARLNPDGTLAPGFPSGFSGVSPGVLSIAVQRDGKALLGGGVILDTGLSRNNIARLNADGTLDRGFQDGLSGAIGNWVNSVALQSDGKVLIGGGFNTVNGVPAPYLVRLWGTDFPPLIKSAIWSGADVNLTWYAISNRTYRVQRITSLATTDWTDLAGDILATGATASKTDSTLGSASQRFYRVLLLP